MQNHSKINMPLQSQQGVRTVLRLLTSITCGVALACTASAQQKVENSDPARPDSLKTAPPKRPYFNDKKVPEAKDLLAIQELLQKSVVKARAATVGVKVGKSSGSGVIVSPDGLVLTAAHVSSGVGKELTIIMEDGKKLKARSLGLNSENDAAMIQILDEGPFPYVSIEQEKERENASTKLGDWVFSLGHSGGFDKARGSGLRLGRLVRIADTTIQSDCTLIGGDSGGPLFDMNGVLVGIHSRVGAATEMNMHVPMHVFYKYWDEMKKSEFIGEGPFAQKPVMGGAFIGIAVEKVENGLKITDVDEASAAGEAGVEIGDILTKVDGKAITEKEELITLMKDKADGDEITLTILKKQTETELKLSLGKR